MIAGANVVDLNLQGDGVILMLSAITLDKIASISYDSVPDIVVNYVLKAARDRDFTHMETFSVFKSLR